MAQVDPFIVPLPQKLALDPQLGPYFQYLQKFLHDIWQRTGAGSDLIGDAAADDEVVHLAGPETVPGDKTFTGNFNLSSTTLKVDGITVVSAQQATVSDASIAADAVEITFTVNSPATAGAQTIADGFNVTAAETGQYIANQEVFCAQVQSDLENLEGQLNLILTRLRAHGLIDT